MGIQRNNFSGTFLSAFLSIVIFSGILFDVYFDTICEDHFHEAYYMKLLRDCGNTFVINAFFL